MSESEKEIAEGRAQNAEQGVAEAGKQGGMIADMMSGFARLHNCAAH